MIANNNIPAGYKDSAVGVIPQEWEVRTFQELGSMLGTNTLSRDKMNECSGCAQNIHYGDVLVKYGEVLDCTSMNIPWVNSDYGNANLGTNLQNGDVVISDTAEDHTVGKATEVQGVGKKIVLSGLHTIAFRPNAGMFAPNFLGYYFNSTIYRAQLYPLIQGIKVCSISKKAISNTKLAMPPKEEQRKIAEILGVWDEAIEKQSRLIEKLELRKRALMQCLLTGRTRLPGFTTPWQKVKLGEIFKERNETKCEHLPLLSITADRGVILQSESDKKDTSNDDKSKYKRICPNDIGYNTMRMWQSRSALSAMEGIVSPAYTIVTPKVEVDPLFISELIKQPRVVYDFWTHSQGLVGDTLNCKFHDFSQVKVAIPSLPEQKAIAEVLTAADNEIVTHRKKLDALRLQKHGLMQQLLTGKTRVKI